MEADISTWRKTGHFYFALTPALRQLGIMECLVCGREVAVFLTRNRRPYTNCGFCLARTFFNGSESIRLLKKKMRPVEE